MAATPKSSTDILLDILADHNALLRAQNNLLGAIAANLATLTAGDADPNRAPNLQADLAGLREYDWEAIGADVLASDEFGPTVVNWRGQNFKRRAPDNAFDPAVWYSRCIGKVD